MSEPARALICVRGRATQQRVRKGTGSEHEGVVLETAAGERLVLVRLGGNPFSDAQTLRLAGNEVEVKGYRIGNEMRYVEASPIG